MIFNLRKDHRRSSRNFLKARLKLRQLDYFIVENYINFKIKLTSNSRGTRSEGPTASDVIGNYVGSGANRRDWGSCGYTEKRTATCTHLYS